MKENFVKQEVVPSTCTEYGHACAFQCK